MRSFLLPLKVLVSGLLIAVVLRHIDLDSLADRFAGQAPVWIIVAGALTLTQIALATLRWERIIKGLGAKVPVVAIARVTYIGSFFNSCLLGNMGGDVARAVLAPEGGIGRSRIVYSVLFDRVATLAGLAIVILPLILLKMGPLARSMPLVASLGAAALPFVGLTMVAFMQPTGVGWGTVIASQIRALGLSWRMLCRSPGRLAAALTIASAGQIAIPAVAYSLARAQHLDVTFVDLLIAIPPVVLLSALPISIGGWGVRENAMVIAMAPLGVTAGSALLISVQMALLVSLISLPGGVMWALRHFERGAAPLVPALR